MITIKDVQQLTSIINDLHIIVKKLKSIQKIEEKEQYNLESINSLIDDVNNKISQRIEKRKNLKEKLKTDSAENYYRFTNNIFDIEIKRDLGIITIITLNVNPDLDLICIKSLNNEHDEICISSNIATILFSGSLPIFGMVNQSHSILESNLKNGISYELIVKLLDNLNKNIIKNDK